MISAFWIISGLLAAGVLLLLLPPLLRKAPDAGPSRDAMNAAVYRDQLRELEADVASGTLSRGGHEEARCELERRVLEDVSGTGAVAPSAGSPAWRAAIAVGVPLPVAAFALYFMIGNPQVMLPGGADAGIQAPHSTDAEQIKVMADRLAARMEREPDDVEGWIMLGRSYGILDRFADAARAYANAVARSGPDAALLADYADALAMAQGRNLAGEPEKILRRALAIDPRNVKALALAGTAAFDRQDYTGAVGYWERIVELVPAGSELAQSVQGSIAEARELAGKSGTSAPATGATAARPAAAGGTVSGIVELSPALAARVAPTDTLFVFARVTEGPRMPLAIIRTQAKELPLKFTLDDSSAMAPGMTLSSRKHVVIEARVSKTGSAMRQPGDLEGASPAVEVGAAGITVLIRSEVR